jgi:putative phosphoribosyl transferase
MNPQGQANTLALWILRREIAIMSMPLLHRKVTPGRHESVMVGAQALPGELDIPANAIGIVLLVEDGEGSWSSQRKLFVTQVLRSYGLGTLLLDLLAERASLDPRPGFDIPLLGVRVREARTWLGQRNDLAGVPLGLFGAGDGAVAVLQAAACLPDLVGAVVSCGGRPDLAGAHLSRLRSPTMLIVEAEKFEVLEFNRSVLRAIQCEKKIEVIPREGGWLEEPDSLGIVAGLAGHWFEQHFSRQQMA